MQVLIAAAPHKDTFGYAMPPPGLARLGGELEREGVEVVLEDLAWRVAGGMLAADDTLAERAAEILAARGRDAGVVGLSVMGATLPVALLVLEGLRWRLPRAFLVLGGAGTSGVDELVLARFPAVDAVVRGEGERTLAELCARLADSRDLSGVAGLTWRDERGRVRREAAREPMRDLGELAPYAWHLLPPLAEYKRAIGADDGLMALDSGRGCVYDCSFCSIGRFWDRRSRTLPAERLADEIESLRAIPGARSAYLCHDLFGANRGAALALCAALVRRGNEASRADRITWEVRARADHLDRELLGEMARAGCWRVLIGVESADERVRERNQKGMRAGTDLLRVVADCLDAGIVPILSLILGLPGEDERALRASLDFCASASLLGGVHLSLHLVNPQPGCALGDEFSGDARAVEGIPPDMAWGAGETAPERALIAAHPDLFTTFALLPADVAHLRALHAIASLLPEVWMRFPKCLARLAARRGVDALDLFRAWTAFGRSFEAFVRAERDPWLDDLLRHEQALVRVAARACSAAISAARGPRFRGELLLCEHDLGTDPRGPAPERAPRVFAVVPGGRGLGTLRISRDVAALCAGLDGTRTVEELEASRPGFATLVARFVETGLIDGAGPAPRGTRARAAPSSEESEARRR